MHVKCIPFENKQKPYRYANRVRFTARTYSRKSAHASMGTHT